MTEGIIDDLPSSANRDKAGKRPSAGPQGGEAVLEEAGETGSLGGGGNGARSLGYPCYDFSDYVSGRFGRGVMDSCWTELGSCDGHLLPSVAMLSVGMEGMGGCTGMM